MARALLMQNPAPPVANQNFTFCCNRKHKNVTLLHTQKKKKKKKEKEKEKEEKMLILASIRDEMIDDRRDRR